MDAQPDYKELLGLFNEHNVEYIIVGSYALAFHGAPRFTSDIDILVNPLSRNAESILSVLNEFGFGTLNLKKEDFQKADSVIQLGVPPVRIDIVTSLTGVSWDEADRGKVVGMYGGIPVPFLGKEQYVKNKRATGRLKDLADLEALGEKI